MTSTNTVVANAVAQRAKVARNADERITEQFSSSVRGKIYKGERPGWGVEINFDGLGSPYSNQSAADCIKQCEGVIKALDEKKQGMQKAIAWLKKNG